MPDLDFLFLEEVAWQARVSLDTVRYWVRKGKLRTVRPGKRRLVRRVDFIRFMQHGASGGSSEADL
jgi:excisionase family DNA binding protein